MAFFCKKYIIKRKKALTDDIFSFTISCKEIALSASAGQFVNIFVPGFTLRRPISICEIDKVNGEITIVFQVRGEGTKVLASFTQGSEIDLLGPLGNGFDLKNTMGKAIFIGGGIGVPPLLEASKAFGINATVILGFRNKDNVILTDKFQKNMNKLFVATDDGSYCEKGFVTDILNKVIQNTEEKDMPQIIYACGPEIMLRKISEIAQNRGIRCQVSLEARMGCGVGACLVCACKTKKNNSLEHSHVCKDGPVFESTEVIFNG